MKSHTRSFQPILYASLAFLLLAGTVSALAADETEKRLSTSSQGKAIQRGSVVGGTVSHNEYDPLKKTGKRELTSRVAGQQKSSVSGSHSTGPSQSGSFDFWIYDADVDLYSDQDFDGFYTGIDVLFDADTIYAEAEVFAVLYLSYELGPWNEYVSTEDFTIFGASGDDEYFIDTELVSGYPTGDYDLLIELFDAYDGTFLASFGPEDSSELSFLPLEDAGRDAPISTTVIVHEGGGGALGWISLLVLLGLFTTRRRLIN